MLRVKTWRGSRFYQRLVTSVLRMLPADQAVNSPTASSRFWTQISGPLFTLATAILIELLSHTIFYIPVPHSVMLTTVMYAAFIGGMRSGFISIAIMMLYTSYYFSMPGQLFYYTGDSVRRIVILLITSPLMVVVVGVLQRRSEQLAQAQLARVRAESALVVAQTERQLLQQMNDRLNVEVDQRTCELAEKVAELARANAELEKLDQMRAEFLALVSHQIRAPLTNIRGAIESITLAQGSDDHSSLRACTIVNQQIDSIDRLVQKVLNTSRIETGAFVLQLEPASIVPMIREAVAQQAVRTPARTVHLPADAALPLVLADRVWVVEVLSNLLDNADKYSPPHTDVYIEVQTDDAFATIVVRDRGCGIPAADRERVFDKFYRVGSGDAQIAYGYGLGLFICRRLIAAHGGQIWVGDGLDGGTTVALTLPLVG